MVLQSEVAECGLACLAMIASFHGRSTDLVELRRRWSVSQTGMALPELMEMCRHINLTPRALRLEPESLRRLSLPCILHWDLDHFVVLERVKRRGCWVVDPAVGRRFMSHAELDKRFTGVALELVPSGEFRRKRPRSRFRFRQLFESTRGLAMSLGQILAFSLAIQVFALALPFYSQLVIDEAIVSRDLDLLNLLFLSFLILVTVQTAISALRSWVVVYVSMKIRLNWSSRVFHHLSRLPMKYFGSRHIGDIQSRFRSLSELQELVTKSFVEAIIDGLMATITIVVLYFYDAFLATLVLSSTLLYLAIRMALFPSLKRQSQEAIVAEAKEDSYFLETIRGLLAIKSFGMEHRRQSGFLNRVTETINRSVPVHRVSIVTDTAYRLIFTFQFLLVVYLAAKSIAMGEFTVGMLVAFLAYRAQFSERSAELVNKAIEFRLARIHLDRLSDIVESDIEPGLDSCEGPTQVSHKAIDGIELHDAWFRYSVTEPFVVSGADLRVCSGEYIAITGPSGFGKTTLLHLLMGLYRPEKGTLSIDGTTLDDYGIQEYRRRCASVMQDDTLLAGTLADNISFFDPKVDMQKVHDCAVMAAIADEIVSMPMQYLSLVGDMGAALSGGQKQRVLLARALYRNPEFLFLDEASSHLDVENERKIVSALKTSGTTVIGVAHRAESLKQADRVIQIDELVFNQLRAQDGTEFRMSG
jgi:ATP-binding cassette subfamily B protein RaxB